jgi:colicin import membrane protein
VRVSEANARAAEAERERHGRAEDAAVERLEVRAPRGRASVAAWAGSAPGRRASRARLYQGMLCGVALIQAAGVAARELADLRQRAADAERAADGARGARAEAEALLRSARAEAARLKAGASHAAGELAQLRAAVAQEVAAARDEAAAQARCEGQGWAKACCGARGVKSLGRVS